MEFLKTMNTTQLERLYRKLWERMTRYDGYQPFGYDWPTVRIVYPGFYAALKMVGAAYLEVQRREAA